LDSDRQVKGAAQGSKQVRRGLKGGLAAKTDFVKSELLYAVEGLKKSYSGFPSEQKGCHHARKP
jgi:hypothetical protein